MKFAKKSKARGTVIHGERREARREMRVRQSENRGTGSKAKKIFPNFK